MDTWTVSLQQHPPFFRQLCLLPIYTSHLSAINNTADAEWVTFSRARVHRPTLPVNDSLTGTRICGRKEPAAKSACADTVSWLIKMYEQAKWNYSFKSQMEGLRSIVAPENFLFFFTLAFYCWQITEVSHSSTLEMKLNLLLLCCWILVLKVKCLYARWHWII